MRLLFLLSILFCFAYNCRSQCWEVNVNNGDTINKIDRNNQKQGNWVIRGKNKRGSCFKPEQIIETGQYLNNRKTGLWIEYYCNYKIRSKLRYVNGVLEGSAIFYDQNEKILEEGSFKANHFKVAVGSSQ